MNRSVANPFLFNLLYNGQAPRSQMTLCVQDNPSIKATPTYQFPKAIEGSTVHHIMYNTN